MRSSLILRIATVLMLVVIAGLPGLRTLDPTVVEAGPPLPRMVGGAVWTGILAASESVDAAADDAEPNERLIVRFRPRAAQAEQLGSHRAAGARQASALSLADTVRVEVKRSDRDRALAAYNARADVLYAEPDYRVHAYYTPNDPRYAEQWALPKVGAPAAWDITQGASTVRVAVIDCGVFSDTTGRAAGDGIAGHPDLRGRVPFNQDFTGSSTGFDDYCDHGSHVAGIIGATGNNGVGISGLAPQVTLMNAKVLGDSGSGYTSDILEGVIWAAQNGAKVVNLSLGRDGTCSNSERETMNWAFGQGVVIVAAAGNSNIGSSGSPANCDNVISVASTTSTDARSSFSNYGTGVDVAAPGSGILSTVRAGGYASYSGTSMASPYVAALAGLLWSRNPSATAQQIVDRIQTTSTQIGGTGTAWSWGRINASAALTGWGSTSPTATLTHTPTQTQTPTRTPTTTQTATSTATATATATSTATPTLTPVPAPSQTSCPSPRPPVQIGTALSGATTLNVTVTAGSGVIRQIGFTQLQNAAVTIEDTIDATAPFLYLPKSFGNHATFTVAQVNGSQAATVSMSVVDDCGAWSTFVGGGTGSFRRGSISGIVRSATTSQPLAGAVVSVRGASRSDTTNGSGAYSIADVGAGNVTLDVSAPGFVAQTVPVTVQQNATATANVNLAPSGSSQEIAVALTWGSSPADLDVHVSGPTTGGSRFHAYWNAASVVSHVTVSADDRNGFGPETATIRRNPDTNAWVPGEYRIWAHNYSGSPGFGGSSARVTVTRGGQQLGVYEVANASGSTSLGLWQSVNVTIDANGNVSLTPVQQLQSGGSNTVLRFSDGAGQPVEWPSGGKR